MKKKKNNKEFEFDMGITNDPIEIEDEGPVEYNRRRKQLADMYAGFIREDLQQLGVSKHEADVAAESLRKSIIDPPEDEDY